MTSGLLVVASVTALGVCLLLLGYRLRAERACPACVEREEADAALTAIAREPETLARLRGMRVDPAAVKARVIAAVDSLRAAGLETEIRVRGSDYGWGLPPKGVWNVCQFQAAGGKRPYDYVAAAQALPEILAEAEKLLTARNAKLRAAGVDAP